MSLSDGKGIENFDWDLIIIKIDEVHLFSDALESRLSAELGEIGTDESVGASGDVGKVNILIEFHVLGVDSEDFHSSDFIGDTDIDFSIESSESSEGLIDGVGSVGGGDDDDLSSGLETVHEGQECGDDSLFDLSVGLVSLGGDRIDLIHEDDGWRVLLSLHESLSEVFFSLSGHLTHDFWTIDQEEEGSSFVGDGSGDQGFS